MNVFTPGYLRHRPCPDLNTVILVHRSVWLAAAQTAATRIWAGRPTSANRPGIRAWKRSELLVCCEACWKFGWKVGTVVVWTLMSCKIYVGCYGRFISVAMVICVGSCGRCYISCYGRFIVVAMWDFISVAMGDVYRKSTFFCNTWRTWSIGQSLPYQDASSRWQGASEVQKMLPVWWEVFTRLRVFDLVWNVSCSTLPLAKSPPCFHLTFVVSGPPSPSPRGPSKYAPPSNATVT